MSEIPEVPLPPEAEDDGLRSSKPQKPVLLSQEAKDAIQASNERLFWLGKIDWPGQL